MPASVTVIVNPISGMGGRSDRGPELHRLISGMLSARGCEAQVCITERVGHARELAAQAARDGVETAVAWGGDGTVNEVASALAFTATRLGIVPVGSGNGLARHLGIPQTREHAFDVALGASVTAIDVGEFDGRHFVNAAGVGIDAAIAHRFAAHGLKRGLRRYVELTLSEVFSYAAQDITILAGGETIRARPLLLTLANGSQFGNGAVIAGSARTDDGLLNLVLASDRSPLMSLLQAPRLFFGGATSLPGVSSRLVTDITISCDKPIRYHVDGEPGVGGATVHARVHPGALRVMVPGSRA